MQPYVLGIDIGTGSTKSIAVNAKGEAFSEMKFHYPTNYPRQGFSEQDPELIWKAFIECITSQVQKLQQQPDAICLSSAMHSLIPVDANGNALADMITWADGRSEDIAERIKSSRLAEELYKNTGTPIHAMSPLCKIIWIRENDKDLFSKTHKFVSIKEYIWFKLFDEFKVDISIASATGLLDIRNNKWNNAALELAGIKEENVSVPVSPAYTSKISNADILSLLHLTSDVTFIIGASDGCLANLGSFTINKHEAALTIGTSGAVRLTSNSPIYNFNTMTFNYRLDEHSFVCGGAINNGGNVLLWFLQNLYNVSNPSTNDYDKFFQEVDGIKPGADKLIFLPYLSGERAPYWDTKSCGTFFGVKTHHTKSHFARAAVEGICYALNNVLLTLEENGQQITHLNVSGGFITSKTWMQILADITGKKICINQKEDASAMGAAYFALKAIGWIEDYKALLQAENVEYIEYNSHNHNLYNNYFSIFKNLYPALKQSMHQLHDLNS
jgi:gluconokinase